MKNQSIWFSFSIFFIFFLFPTFSISAQQKTLMGAIVIGNAEVMSYKVTYELNSKNLLSGYSVCDINGNEETKARITGYYNPKNKTLNFEEKSIISTKSKTPSDEFCLMKVNGKFEMKGGKRVFTGNFESKSHNDGISCDSGTLLLLTEKTMNALTTKATRALEKAPIPDSNNKEVKTKPAEGPWIRNTIELSAGIVKEFGLTSNDFQLDLIDDRFQDGDKITLLRNNATVVNRFEITNQVKSFKFTLNKEEKDVTFTIKADDEGSIALTTIKAVLRNGNEVNNMVISLHKGESVKIVLKRDN